MNLKKSKEIDIDIHSFKKRLQDHFTDGLVIIIGSGLSCAEGLPGMGDLANYLKVEVPKKIDKSDIPLWTKIDGFLEQGKNIEQAMTEVTLTESLESHVVNLIANLFHEQEIPIIDKVLRGTRTLRFSRLLPHLLKDPNGIPVITTNYDRLIEIGTEMGGLGVDTLFVGNHFGSLNQKASKMSFCRDIKMKHKNPVLQLVDRILLLKPHGSIDWYLCSDRPIRCPYNISQPQLIITPGINKFRNGYDRPFDLHREIANKRIDAARQFLIIGYGFNDDHLQTHLEARLRDGAKALVLVNSLTDNAQKVVDKYDGTFAITAMGEPNKSGALLIEKNKRQFVHKLDLWDLDIFVREVLET